MNDTPELTRNFIIKVAIISEGILLLIALIWGSARGIPLPLTFDLESIATGIIATIPVLFFNFVLFSGLSKDKNPENVFWRFKSELIIPLCRNLDVKAAAILGITSGIGEEFLFRGVLNFELSGLFGAFLGLSISSYLFAYVHFIGIAREYWKVLMFYLAFGLYFTIIAAHFDSLTPAIIAHGLYNFSAIVYIRYIELKPSESS